MLARVGLALPYVAAASAGVLFLFAAKGARSIRAAGAGVGLGTPAPGSDSVR